MKILPLDCLATFFEEARRSGVFELYYIDLSTGLRRGELLGIKWGDIDLNEGVIRVQRQILLQNGAVVEAPLKTKNFYRNIAIGTDTVELLRQMKQRSTSEYVFPSPTGGPISPDSVLHMLQRVLKRAGLEKIPFHSLRHTFSVLALQNGVDIKTLSSMMGHTPQDFTLNTYAHKTTAMQTKAANAASSFLSGAIQQIPRIGQNLSQKWYTKINTRKKQAKLRRNHPISPEFWHAVKNSNPRPSGP